MADHLHSGELLLFLLALGTLLATARLLGDFARKLGQPAVLGELLAGLLLGKTVLGAFAPGTVEQVFTPHGPAAVALYATTQIAVVLLLLVAGMEVDLSRILRQRRVAVAVSVAGIAVPFALGLTSALLAPRALGWEGDQHRTLFAFFFAIALSISALPIIVRTLVDLNLYRTDLGMIVVAAAVTDDLLGWICFSLVVGTFGAAGAEGGHGYATPLFILAFTWLMLTGGRRAVHAALARIDGATEGPGAILGFAVSLALIGAALAQAVGAHAFFGAFLVGVTIGSSPHLTEHVRATLHDFVTFIFAPLFFASVGLRVDFFEHFDVGLVLLVLVIASVGKIAGCTAAARWAGTPAREAWAIGFAMNSRGAVEIVLALAAREAGLVGDRLFVALVVMALTTSLVSGPLMKRTLARRRAPRLVDFLHADTFLPTLEGADRFDAIHTLALAAASRTNVPAATVADAAVARERLMSTALGDGIAVPHARVEGVLAPVVAVGIARAPIDWDAPDGDPARLVLFVLTPSEDDSAQLAILADIAGAMTEPAVRERALRAATLAEFRAAITAPPLRASVDGGGGAGAD